ncbi:MAG TPA: NADH-quinone oxidoreductase subunit J [Gemmataceae bacterium]|jgi:NADH-quinone oxidoreductase subunit J|nr:NADH-quinone oxidoreductase subunit J [Gemmataceae bacterium]
MQPFLFWVIASVTIGCAIATVVTHNIVRAASWLLFTLAGTSGLFFLIGADLVGAIQLLVYVGGTLILVVFGVMLTAQGPFVSMRTSSAEWAVSAATGIALLALLVISTQTLKVGDVGARKGTPTDDYKPELRTQNSPAQSPYTIAIGAGFTGVGVGPAHEIAYPRRPAGDQSPKFERTNYLLPFEIVSVHLLVVLIGAAYLARTKRRREATP